MSIGLGHTLAVSRHVKEVDLNAYQHRRHQANVQWAIRIQFGARTFMACVLGCILFSSFRLAGSGEEEVSASGAVNGRDPSVSRGVDRTETTIRVHSDLVLIPVTVTDRRGRAVSGLEKEHFTLFEDNAQQEISYFAAKDAPASVGIVFDASDSMGPKLREARDAVNALLSSINPNSEFFLVKFSTRAQIVVPMTSRLEEIRDCVDKLSVDGSTALLDGVRLAMAEMTQARYSRKAIIIISDGDDNCSHWTISALKTAVREQDILIYAIAITNPPEPYASSLQQLGEALLKEIASQTGGCMFPVNRVQQLHDIGDKIGGWLRNQYMLGYAPNHSATDGTYRKVQLKVIRPKGYPRLHAAWRQGYYAPKE